MTKEYCFVEIVVSVLGIGGYGNKFFVEAADVPVAKSDPLAFAAQCFKVTPAQYLQWLDSNGFVRCSGRTKAGKQCKGDVPGVRFYKPAEWLSHPGGYCHRHDPGQT